MHDDRVAELADEIHVVFDHAEGVAAILVQPQDRVADGVQKRPVHAGADLVEEDDLGVDHHRAAKFQQLLLPARDLARGVVGRCSMVRNSSTSSALARSARSSSAMRRGRTRCSRGFRPTGRGHHHQVLAAGHRGELMRDLEGAQAALVKQLVRRQAGDVLAIHRHACPRSAAERPRSR
jgi:hypothetical protein